jgi:XRE family aerobic/anaerobic benzoate catabolism transcriptional regulator
MVQAPQIRPLSYRSASGGANPVVRSFDRPARDHLIRINATARAAGNHAGRGSQGVADSKTQFREDTGYGFAGQAPPDASAYSETEFLTLLGDRVRAMRLLRDMSRRELARRSRVSERYIAQIEAGKGNVSIMLLLRIAQAVRGD